MLDLVSTSVKGDAEYINYLLMELFRTDNLIKSSVTGRSRTSKTLQKLDENKINLIKSKFRKLFTLKTFDLFQ